MNKLILCTTVAVLAISVHSTGDELLDTSFAPLFRHNGEVYIDCNGKLLMGAASVRDALEDAGYQDQTGTLCAEQTTNQQRRQILSCLTLPPSWTDTLSHLATRLTDVTSRIPDMARSIASLPNSIPDMTASVSAYAPSGSDVRDFVTDMTASVTARAPSGSAVSDFAYHVASGVAGAVTYAGQIVKDVYKGSSEALKPSELDHELRKTFLPQPPQDDPSAEIALTQPLPDDSTIELVDGEIPSDSANPKKPYAVQRNAKRYVLSDTAHDLFSEASDLEKAQSGNYPLLDALQAAQTLSRELTAQETPVDGIFVPLALGREIIQTPIPDIKISFKRSHYVLLYARANEVTIFDSLSGARNYDMTPILRWVHDALGDDVTIQSIYTNDQRSTDFSSCGHYVMGYISAIMEGKMPVAP